MAEMVREGLVEQVREEGLRLPQPSWELVLRRNSIERLKLEKHPLDIRSELPELIAKGYEAVPEEDIVRLNWWGVTHDKPKVGTFMVRVKIPGGLVTPAQLAALARISREYGRGYAELTTRQGIQLHWVRLEALPEVLEAVEAAGLSTAGGEGDTVRNITSCPVAGIDPAELFDVRPVVEAAARFFYGNRDYSNLPRKHKYTISACPAQCNAPEIHDVALVGAVKDGRPGFALRVGGGLSATPRISRDIGVFIPLEPVEGVIEVLRAVTDVWQEDLRYRVSRAKARIKFMLDDYGPEGFRRLLENRLGVCLEDFTCPPPVGRADHLGLHPQRQEGYFYLGVPVPAGRASADQLEGLAEVVGEIGGDVRFTREQNFIVGWVPEERVSWLEEALRRLGLDPERNPLYGTSTACTSHQFCNYSVAETKEKLEEILAELEERFGTQLEGLTLYVDGCPHACAHHWVGEIGLQGTTTTEAATGRRVEAYNVALGGGLGTRAAIGRVVLKRVPSGEVGEAVSRLVGAWLEARKVRGSHYSFQDFCRERTDEELQALALGRVAAEGRGAGVVLRIFGPFLELAGGADHLELEGGTVREVLEAARRTYPALVEAILTPEGQVSTAANIYLGEEDIRSLQGLETPVRPGQEVVVLPAMSGG